MYLRDSRTFEVMSGYGVASQTTKAFIVIIYLKIYMFCNLLSDRLKSL